MYTFYYQKSTEIEINIGRWQKQVIGVVCTPIESPLQE